MYKYKLKLKHKFPMTIFKERNVSLSIELIDDIKSQVMNCKSLLIQPISSTSAWLPAKPMGNGSPRLSKENTSCRARQKPISTTDRPPLPRSIPET